MTVDLSSLKTQVIIHDGATDLDVSQSFISLSLTSGTWDDGGWFKLRGTLQLAGFVWGYAESFDCRLNPSRWAPGNIVAISLWFGSWVAIPTRLRILRYPNRPWPGNIAIDLELGSDGDLLNYRAPEGNPTGITYGTPTGATFLINGALSRAGAPALTDTISDLSLPFSPGKTGGSSWITYAGQVAYAAGRVLWQQGDGDVRATALEMDGLEPFATYIVGSQEADYIPETGSESPPETVKVTGTTYQIDSVQDESFVTVDVVDGVTVRTTVSYTDRNTDSPTYTEKVEQPANVVLPAFFSTAELITATELTKVENYTSIGFRLNTEVETLRQPVAAIFPNSLFGTPTELAIANRTTVAFTYDADDNTIIRKTTLERAIISGITVTLGTSQITTEKWEKAGNEEWAYTRNQVNFDTNTSSLPQRRGASANNTPPQARYRPATKQRLEKESSGTASFTNLAGAGFAEKLQVITLPGGMAVSNAQCRAIAQRAGRLRQGRQFAVAWAADITAAWLQSFTPVRRIDFIVPEPGVPYDATATYAPGEVVYYQTLSYRATASTTGNLPTNASFWEPANIRTAYLIEALNINIDQRSAAIGGRGVEIGIVSRNEPIPAPSDPGDAPPVLPEPAKPFVLKVDVEIGLQYGALQLGASVDVTTVATIGIQYGQLQLGAVVDVEIPITAATLGLQYGQLQLGASVNVVQLAVANIGLQYGSLQVGVSGVVTPKVTSGVQYGQLQLGVTANVSAIIPAGEEGFFILAGQSNAEGHTANPGFTYDFLRTTIYRKATGHTTDTDDGTFDDLVFGALGNNSLDAADNEADVGAEVAKRFEANDPANLRMVKVAVGATGFDGGTGAWARGGVLREALINRYLRRAIPDAVTAGDQVNILPVLWIQGENEATNSGWASTYQADLTAFIADVRGATGIPTLPFVIVKLHDDINTTLHPHASTVRAAQVAVDAADANTYLLDPSAITDYNGEHYGITGFEELAQQYYDLAATIGATPYALNTDAAAFVARLGGSYTDRERHGINSFVATTDLRPIVAGGSQWDACNAIWLRTLDTAADSRLNLKSTSYSLVDNNSPTFTANQGMQYNGTSQYTLTGINPNTINSGSAAGMIGVYLRQDDNDESYWMTAFDGTRATTLQNDINANGRFFGFMNRTAGTVTLSGSSNEQGAISVYRGASTTAGLVQNQLAEATATMTGSAVVNAEISLMAFTTNGASPELYSANQLGAAWASIGVAWMPAEVRLFHAEIQQILTVFGANV